MTHQRDVSFLVRLLAPSLGPAVAQERVMTGVRHLRLSSSMLTEAQALAVLEQLTTEKGIVGSAARFAKVRLLLAWAQD